MASPNRIDRNASSLNRLRRNMQRLTLGAATSTMVLNPDGALVNDANGLRVLVDGSTIIIGDLITSPTPDALLVNLFANGALGQSSTDGSIKVRVDADRVGISGTESIRIDGNNNLAVALKGDNTIRLSSTGLFVPLVATGGIQVLPNSSGGLFISIGAGQIGNLLATDSTGLVLFTQNSTTVFAGPSTGAAAQPTFRKLTTNDIPTLTSTQLPGDVAYTDAANNFSQAQRIFINADPGSPGDGTFWYNSTATVKGWKQQVFGMERGGIGVVTQAIANGTVVASTTTLQSTYASAVFPANFFVPGRAVRITAEFKTVMNATSTSITAGMYWVGGNSGSTVNVDQLVINGANIVSGTDTFMETVWLVCRTTGTTATFAQLANISDSRAAIGVSAPTGIGTTVTLDTTQSCTFQLLASFGSSTTTSNMTGTLFMVEVLDVP